MFINKIRIISYNITVLNRVGDFLNTEMKQNKINFLIYINGPNCGWYWCVTRRRYERL